MHFAVAAVVASDNRIGRERLVRRQIDAEIVGDFNSRSGTGNVDDAGARVPVGHAKEQSAYEPAVEDLENAVACGSNIDRSRSEEHTSELQSLMRISYAVFCLKKKKNINTT